MLAGRLGFASGRSVLQLALESAFRLLCPDQLGRALVDVHILC
jgi:hypothetical protein